MIKSILVALDGSQHADAALDHALWLAERLKATARRAPRRSTSSSIEGSFLHDISGSLGFEPYLDFSSKMREALQERGTRAPRRLPRSAATERDVACDTVLLDGHRRQRDLRPGPHRRPGRRRAPRRQRAVLDRAARRHDGVGDAQVPEAASSSRRIGFQPSRPGRSSPTTAPSAPAPRMHAAAELASALRLPLTVVHVAAQSGGERDRGARRGAPLSASLRPRPVTVPHGQRRRRTSASSTSSARAATTCSSSAPTATAASSRWCSAAPPSTCCATAPAPSSCRADVGPAAGCAALLGFGRSKPGAPCTRVKACAAERVGRADRGDHRSRFRGDECPRHRDGRSARALRTLPFPSPLGITRESVLCVRCMPSRVWHARSPVPRRSGSRSDVDRGVSSPRPRPLVGRPTPLVSQRLPDTAEAVAAAPPRQSHRRAAGGPPR